MQERESRRDVLRKGAIASGVAGAAWVAPQLLSTASAQASLPCTGTLGYFTWDRAAYTVGSRSGAPGGPNQMTAASGWASHPTFPNANGTGTATPVTITYRMSNATYLNTGAAPNGGQGHGVAGAGNSAVFKSYRVSKIGSGANGPPLNDALLIVIQFSALVRCPTITIGDLDNNLPASNNPSCSGPVATGSPFWADGLSAVGYSAIDAGGFSTPGRRIAAAGGSNLSPAVGAVGPWQANACQSIPQSSDASDVTIQFDGGIRELRLQYISRYQQLGGPGNQHMALGNISFRY